MAIQTNTCGTNNQYGGKPVLIATAILNRVILKLFTNRQVSLHLRPENRPATAILARRVTRFRHEIARSAAGPREIGEIG